MTVLLWISFFLSFFLVQFLMSWIPSMLKMSGATVQQGSVAFALANLSSVMATFFMGRMMDKLDAYRVIMVSFLISTFTVALVRLDGGLFLRRRRHVAISEWHLRMPVAAVAESWRWLPFPIRLSITRHRHRLVLRPGANRRHVGAVPGRVPPRPALERWRGLLCSGMRRLAAASSLSTVLKAAKQENAWRQKPRRKAAAAVTSLMMTMVDTAARRPRPALPAI